MSTKSWGGKAQLYTSDWNGGPTVHHCTIPTPIASLSLPYRHSQRLYMLFQALKYPDQVDGNIPSNVPIMYPTPRKKGGNGEKWGGGGNGVKWGVVWANNKNCGARWSGLEKMGLVFPQHGNLLKAWWYNLSPASGHGASRAFPEPEPQQHKATHC